MFLKTWASMREHVVRIDQLTFINGVRVVASRACNWWLEMPTLSFGSVAVFSCGEWPWNQDRLCSKRLCASWFFWLDRAKRRCERHSDHFNHQLHHHRCPRPLRQRERGDRFLLWISVVMQRLWICVLRQYLTFPLTWSNRPPILEGPWRIWKQSFQRMKTVSSQRHVEDKAKNVEVGVRLKCKWIWSRLK